MRPITEKQFNAYCFFKTAYSRVIHKEKAWYETRNKKLLAMIVLDKINNDYGFIILGRNINRLFYCLEASAGFSSLRHAVKALKLSLQKFEDDGLLCYPVEGETIIGNQLFEPLFSEEKLHSYFKRLRDNKNYEAARELIKEIVYSYRKKDIKNFISDFQTKFDARLWELFLYVYFYNSGFEIIEEHDVPDYHLSLHGEEFFVEATTTNPHPEDSPEHTVKDIDRIIYKYYCSLTAKLKKKYWEKAHVQGKPFIIALEDFSIPASGHEPSSHLISSTPITEYLYGIEVEKQPTPKIKPRAKHLWNERSFDSNFFAYPNAENVSAILFSNQGTITKFNRMGKLAGLGGENVKMIRQGTRLNPNPGALEPIPFIIDIDSPNYEETWTEGFTMLHNPSATYPVDPYYFPGISHIFFDKQTNELCGRVEDNKIFNSTTLLVPIEEWGHVRKVILESTSHLGHSWDI